jgi:hypothetical protein
MRCRDFLCATRFLPPPRPHLQLPRAHRQGKQYPIADRGRSKRHLHVVARPSGDDGTGSRKNGNDP